MIIYNDELFCVIESHVTPGQPTEASEKLAEAIDLNNRTLLDVQDEVPKAIKYAQDLNMKSMELEALLTVTRNLTRVRAASVYQDIANNINAAKQLAEDAVKSVDNATNLVRLDFCRIFNSLTFCSVIIYNNINYLMQVNGLGENSLRSEEKSSDLLNGARTAVLQTNRDLKPVLNNAKYHDVYEIADQNEKNNATLDRIEK